MKKLFFIILGTILTVSSVYGISNLTIIPSDPKVGDTITITGKADPNEEINCQIWFEINPSVHPPEYEYIMNNVEIPDTPNSFKIIAENVNKLYIFIKMGMWITKKRDANQKGVAEFSKNNVPSGTYDIEIRGTIKDPEKPVKLKIFASTKIKADENGNFDYSYRVNNIPGGTVVHLDIGGIKKDMVIKSSVPTPPPVDTEDEIDKDDDISTGENSIDEENVENSTPVFPRDTDRGNLDNIDTQEGSKSTTENKIITDEKNNYNTTANKEDIKGDNCNTSVNNTDNIKDIPDISKRDNIIHNTVVKNIGSAILIIPNGTRISRDGKISIREINIPNTTVAYYISPGNAEFSKPLILKIHYNISQDKRITVLYYDRYLKKWTNIPYTYDKNTVIVKIPKSGYYAIKEEYVEKNSSIIDKLLSIPETLRIIITLLLDYLQIF